MAIVHLTIYGRVQGVGFRWFVRQVARDVGAAGWVRNLPDGSVELAARGPDDAIARLVQAARRGPPGAHVDRVVEQEGSQSELADLPTPFSVVRST